MEIRNDRLICGSQRPFKIKFDVFFLFLHCEMEVFVFVSKNKFVEFVMAKIAF